MAWEGAEGAETVLVDPNKPAMRGFELFVDEFMAHSSVPVHREDIDWESVCYEEWGWSPTNFETGKTHPGQVMFLNMVFQERKKVIIIRAGKRSGKTIACLQVGKLFHKCVPGARGWVASSSYNLADKMYTPLWTSLTTDKGFPDILDKSRKDHRIRMAGGGLAEAHSWQDEDTIEGESLDYCILDEAQTLDETRFNLFYARTVDRGGVLVLIGSPASDDAWMLEMCEAAKTKPNWGYVEWTIDDNPFPEVEFIEEARADLDEDAFAEMFLNKTRTPKGLVFGRQFDQKLNVFRGEPDPNLPMYVCIDPGTKASAYAVGFIQIVPARTGSIEEVRLFDEIYENETFSDLIITEHFLPHRYRPQVIDGVMDIAGRAHHDRPDSPKELWQDLAKIPIHDTKVDVVMGIERTKSFLLQPGTGVRRLKIHERCLKTIGEFGQYRYAQKNVNGGERKLPIDAWNHMMKALAYFLVYYYGYWRFDNKGAGKLAGKAPRPKGRLDE